jgi:flagellar hook protein FlgE
MPASATAAITMNGNLRSSASTDDVTFHRLTANTGFTASSGTPITAASYMSDLDQWTVPLGVGNTGTLRISGATEDGTVFTNQDETWTGAAAGAGDTMQDVLDQVSALFDHSTATVNSEGKITITDDEGGYSMAQITAMSYVPSGADRLTTPTFFDLTAPGGNDSKAFNINIYDSMGEPHVMSGYLVKTDTTNTWDLIVPSITGETSPTWAGYDLNSTTFNRRISGIQFNSDGSYAGLTNPAEPLTLGVQYDNIPGTQTITFDLGTEGEFTGLTQFYSEQSSANALSQDGYEAGTLSSITIDQSGMVLGTFTNGVKRNVAALQIGVFQNPGGTEAVGNGYFLPSANSGDPIATTAATGGAGVIKGQSLEKSNVDIATEFVNMMQAQNGYQANARTIRVANSILSELTNLIR